MLFANNATSRLRIVIPAASSTITVAPGDGAKFPVIAPLSGDWFSVTLQDLRNGTMEICKCTAHTGDVLTVVRGQEGTTAQDFYIGANVSNRQTAGTLDYFLSLVTGTVGYSVEDADNLFVFKAGDIMTGQLKVGSDPSASNDLSRKSYVDARDAERALLVHTHAITDVTGLTTALDGKAPTVHTHTTAQVVGLDTFIATTQSDITSLTSTKLADAPNNANQYARKGGAWQVVTAPAGVVLEAPNDANRYVRKANAWQILPDTDVAVGEAPSNGTAYGRMDAGWTQVLKLSGGVLAGSLSISNTGPLFELYDEDGIAGNRRARMINDTGQLRFEVRSDDGTTSPRILATWNMTSGSLVLPGAIFATQAYISGGTLNLSADGTKGIAYSTGIADYSLTGKGKIWHEANFNPTTKLNTTGGAFQSDTSVGAQNGFFGVNGAHPRYIWQYNSGISKKMWMDGSGSVIIGDVSTGAAMWYITAGGQMYTAELGDLNTRIENRAQAWAINYYNASVTSIRTVGHMAILLYQSTSDLWENVNYTMYGAQNYNSGNFRIYVKYQQMLIGGNWYNTG
jgi:hypothetical protein